MAGIATMAALMAGCTLMVFTTVFLQPYNDDTAKVTVCRPGLRKR
jgi:hypothetical protein